jgi:hypothetical protein
VKKNQNHKCEFPGCLVRPAKHFWIKTSWFRGDDVGMFACTEHRKDAHNAELLKTEKAQRQMA